MLQSFIITLREGVEAALIVGITLAYLNKIGRHDLNRVVYWALGAAVAGSVACAYVVSRMGINQEAVEGWIMLTAAFFVITMIWFMSRAARTLKGEIETKVGAMAGAGSQFGLFAFIFLMVLREGFETVLILEALTFNTNELLSFLGTILGLGLAVVFGVTFVKGSVRINLGKFFRVTTVILVFVAFQLIVSGLHELSEAGIIPASKRSMALIGPIVSNSAFFVVTILALAALMILFEYRRRGPAPAASAGTAEGRKALWTERRERLWMSGVYGSAFVFIVLVTAQFLYAKSQTALSPATEVTFTDGRLEIPIVQVAGGDLHRFATMVDGTRVRFILMERPDGNIASIYDTCEICGPVGFYQSPEGITCKNCEAPIALQSLGQGGGCNPVPLQAQVSETIVTILQADLAAHMRHFQE